RLGAIVARRISSTLAPVAALLGLLCLAPSAFAAWPIRGGRYAGKWTAAGSPRSGGQRGGYLAFNVDDRGRAFVSDPRVVFEGSEINAPCMERPWDLGGTERYDVGGNYTLSNGTAVRIRPDGTFVLSMAAQRDGR